MLLRNSARGLRCSGCRPENMRETHVDCRLMALRGRPGALLFIADSVVKVGVLFSKGIAIRRRLYAFFRCRNLSDDDKAAKGERAQNELSRLLVPEHWPL